MDISYIVDKQGTNLLQYSTNYPWNYTYFNFVLIPLLESFVLFVVVEGHNVIKVFVLTSAYIIVMNFLIKVIPHWIQDARVHQSKDKRVLKFYIAHDSISEGLQRTSCHTLRHFSKLMVDRNLFNNSSSEYLR